jgi:hypothetical protein
VLVANFSVAIGQPRAGVKAVGADAKAVAMWGCVGMRVCLHFTHFSRAWTWADRCRRRHPPRRPSPVSEITRTHAMRSRCQRVSRTEGGARGEGEEVEVEGFAPKKERMKECGCAHNVGQARLGSARGWAVAGSRATDDVDSPRPWWRGRGRRLPEQRLSW